MYIYMLPKQVTFKDSDQFVYKPKGLKVRKYKKSKKMSQKEWEKSPADKALDKRLGYAEGSKEDKELDKKMRNMKKKKGLKLNPPSKGRTPKGARGRAAVKALGRTKTTGNFDKIKKAYGKGAAVAAYQNALAKHQGRPTPFRRAKTTPKTGVQMLRKAMKKMC